MHPAPLPLHLPVSSTENLDVAAFARTCPACARRVPQAVEVCRCGANLAGVALAGRPCILMPGPYATTEQVDEGVNFLRNLEASLPVDRA